MTNVIKTIIDNWHAYGVQTTHMVLYWIALVWIYLYDRRQGNARLPLQAVFSFLGITAIMAAGRIFLGGYLPYKIFLILPTAVLLAYVGVELLGRTELLKKRWIIILLYAIIIQAGIGLRYEPEFLTGAPNTYKISASVIGLDHYIRQIDQPFLLAPSEVAASIQEYDPGVRVAYGEGYGYAEGNLLALIESAEGYGCNCLLLRSETADMEYMQSQGYELVVILEGYHLYRL